MVYTPEFQPPAQITPTDTVPGYKDPSKLRSGRVHGLNPSGGSHIANSFKGITEKGAVGHRHKGDHIKTPEAGTGYYSDTGTPNNLIDVYVYCGPLSIDTPRGRQNAQKIIWSIFDTASRFDPQNETWASMRDMLDTYGFVGDPRLAVNDCAAILSENLTQAIEQKLSGLNPQKLKKASQLDSQALQEIGFGDLLEELNERQLIKIRNAVKNVDKLARDQVDGYSDEKLQEELIGIVSGLPKDKNGIPLTQGFILLMFGAGASGGAYLAKKHPRQVQKLLIMAYLLNACGGTAQPAPTAETLIDTPAPAVPATIDTPIEAAPAEAPTNTPLPPPQSGITGAATSEFVGGRWIVFNSQNEPIGIGIPVTGGDPNVVADEGWQAKGEFFEEDGVMKKWNPELKDWDDLQLPDGILKDDFAGNPEVKVRFDEDGNIAAWDDFNQAMYVKNNGVWEWEVGPREQGTPIVVGNEREFIGNYEKLAEYLPSILEPLKRDDVQYNNGLQIPFGLAFQAQGANEENIFAGVFAGGFTTDGYTNGGYFVIRVPVIDPDNRIQRNIFIVQIVSKEAGNVGPVQQGFRLLDLDQAPDQNPFELARMPDFLDVPGFFKLMVDGGLPVGQQVLFGFANGEGGPDGHGIFGALAEGNIEALQEWGLNINALFLPGKFNLK